ncbi:adenylate/guanylate cyclase domain-containing protein [Ruegeria sp. SCP11]|uniref:adenylate/guanylate cyclase domain-containing protein n=1 Tax=Ruegeria sp. SCP11 TaxID=3141378 RepID=UPI003335BB0E
MERRLAAILAADVVGFSRLTEANEEGTVTRLKELRSEIIHPEIAEHRGRVVKLMGDGALVEFASVVEAISCAVTVQRDVAAYNAELSEDDRIEFRMGINLGDIVVEDDDIYGDGVNIAARLEALADPGGICISGTAFDQVKTKFGAGFESLGALKVKNIAEPVRAYRVLLGPEDAGKVVGVARPVLARWLPTAITFAILALVGGAFGIAWQKPWASNQEQVPVASSALPLPDKPSIAVLPFANMSGDMEQEYFADGMTEDIISDLSDFGLFFVISRNSSFAYKDVSVDIKDAARELGVQYILEGSVRKSGDSLRITARFVDALADKHIWAERYNRELQEIFQVQDEITQRIVTSVAPEYLSAELKRAQRMETHNLDAWDAFMRGYWHLLRYTKDDNAKAQQFLRQAIDLEPNQANSHSVLAVTYLMDGFFGWSESREESFQEALLSAERGLALDSQDSQALRSIGLVHFFSNNHDAALGYYERAVAANPKEAENLALLGAALGVAGKYDAALEQYEAAFRLSPRDVHIATWYGYLSIAAFVAGLDEEAVGWARKAVEANPQFPGGYRTLAASAGNLGQFAEAEAARGKLLELLPHLTIAQLRENLPYFKNTGDLERYLDGLLKAGLPEGTTE